MARLPRLALPGLPHLVALYGQGAQPVFLDDEDRAAFQVAFREAAIGHQVAVHGYALADDHVHLLVTPASAAALGTMVQALGRRYVAGFNRRHGRRGTLWAGRYRATVVQPGAPLLDALLFVDLHGQRAAQRAGLDTEPADDRRSSVRHHLGLLRDPLLTGTEAYWQLGNTPFEREAAYRRLLDDGLPAVRVQALADAARKGWAYGDAVFLKALAQQTARPLQPRPRGRPARDLL